MIKEIAAKLGALKIATAIADGDRMFRPGGERFYFAIGRSAARIVMTALIARLGYAGADQTVSRILDFGAGYGRATRFFRAAFPDAEVAVIDRDPEAVRWCVEALGAVEGALEPDKYDVIFLGSVITHTPPTVTEKLLVKLIDSLSDGGLLIFTILGRFERFEIIADRDHPTYRGITQEAKRKLVTEYDACGYGFIEHPAIRDYGISLIKPEWIDATIGQRKDLVRVLSQEKAFGHHQDGIAYLKMPLMKRGFPDA